MSPLDHLEIGSGIARFRPAGPSSLVSAVELIASVIGHCRARGIARLLVDTTALEGIAIPSLVDRFVMIEEWAREADGKVAVAIVVRPEYMHPTKFGVQVATDMGMVFDVYATEAEAMRWLAKVTTTFGS